MDPREVMMELESLNAMEFNPHHPGQEVICRTRKELEETLLRETELCAWKDPELHAKLEKYWSEYLVRQRR